MNPEDKMTIEERYQYLGRMKKRYQKADRRERSKLLDEMEAYTGLHRKSIIRLVGTELQRRPPSRERGYIYGSDIRAIVAVTAQAPDYPCAERLQSVLLTTAQHLARRGMLSLNSAQEEQLTRLGVAMLRRMLNGLRRDKPCPLPRSPQDHNPWRRDVPMLRLPYNLQEPGHMDKRCPLAQDNCEQLSYNLCAVTTGHSLLSLHPRARSDGHPGESLQAADWNPGRRRPTADRRPKKV